VTLIAQTKAISFGLISIQRKDTNNKVGDPRDVSVQRRDAFDRLAAVVGGDRYLEGIVSGMAGDRTDDASLALSAI
jgi:hypothetical protein